MYFNMVRYIFLFSLTLTVVKVIKMMHKATNSVRKKKTTQTT